MKLTNISAPPLVLSLDYYYYYFYFISQTVRPFLYLLPSIYRFLSFSSGQIKKENLILILVFAINLGRFLFLLNYLALVTLCTWYITSAMRVLFQLSYSNTSIWLTCIYIAMIYSHAHFDQSWNSMPPPPSNHFGRYVLVCFSHRMYFLFQRNEASSVSSERSC